MRRTANRVRRERIESLVQGVKTAHKAVKDAHTRRVVVLSASAFIGFLVLLVVASRRLKSYVDANPVSVAVYILIGVASVWMKKQGML